MCTVILNVLYYYISRPRVPFLRLFRIPTTVVLPTAAAHYAVVHNIHYTQRVAIKILTHNATKLVPVLPANILLLLFILLENYCEMRIIRINFYRYVRGPGCFLFTYTKRRRRCDCAATATPLFVTTVHTIIILYSIL